MKTPFYYALCLIVPALMIAIFCSKKIRGISEEVQFAERSVDNYGNVKNRAAQAVARSRELEKNGGVPHSYQLALSESQQLPAKIERQVSEAGLTLLERRFTNPYSITVVGSNLNATKLLLKFETDFPDLKLTSTKWVGQGDGAVSVQANFDVWTLPTPVGQLANK